MSRYVDIEGDWVDEAIKTYSLGYYDDDEYAIPFEALDSAPSIDIVRCRECKHWQPHEQYGYDEDNDEYHDYCGLLVPDDDYYAFMRTADDFCSYGERRNK